MNCPHCQSELPENYPADYCLFCGKNLVPNKSGDVEIGVRYFAPVRFRGALFFVILLLPPLLTAAIAWLVKTPNESYSVAMGLLGGGAGGIACGIMIGLRLGRTLLGRMGLGLLFSVIMVVVCITLCCFGCNFGGYELNLH